jgi:hypothetical protein
MGYQLSITVILRYACHVPKLLDYCIISRYKTSNNALHSVAMAIADVFRNNGISMGRNLAKILKIFKKIDEAKSQGVI